MQQYGSSEGTWEYLFIISVCEIISRTRHNRKKFIYVRTGFSYGSACETTLKKLLPVLCNCVSIEFEGVTYLLII